MGINQYDDYSKQVNPIERMGIGESSPELRKIALKVFGSTDGVRPKFPRSGELIQEAMEKAYEMGKTVGRGK